MTDELRHVEITSLDRDRARGFDTTFHYTIGPMSPQEDAMLREYAGRGQREAIEVAEIRRQREAGQRRPDGEAVKAAWEGHGRGRYSLRLGAVVLQLSAYRVGYSVQLISGAWVVGRERLMGPWLIEHARTYPDDLPAAQEAAVAWARARLDVFVAARDMLSG